MTSLQLLDQLVSDGHSVLTPSLVRNQAGVSPQSASNFLSRWIEAGLVDRVAHGRYAVRPIGLLHTRASSEDAGLAVAAFYGNRPHRIGFRSALDYHGLLIHPTRSIQVASSTRVRVKELSGRPFVSVFESDDTLSIGAEKTDSGAFISSLERSIIDVATKPKLGGGASVLAEALMSAAVDSEILQKLLVELQSWQALRRIGTVADHLGLTGLVNDVIPMDRVTTDIQLDTRIHGLSEYRDPFWRVQWSESPASMISSVSN